MGGIPSSVEDHAAAAIMRYLIAVFTWKRETLQEYWWTGISFELILVQIWLFCRLCCSAVELELEAGPIINEPSLDSLGLSKLNSFTPLLVSNPSLLTNLAWFTNDMIDFINFWKIYNNILFRQFAQIMVVKMA
jgi:hypothetical protein